MGLTLLGLGGFAHLTASLTGQGSTMEYAIPEEVTAPAAPQATIAPAPHGAAPIVTGTSTLAGVTIILGMILILTGLLLHALLLLRVHGERNVPVRVTEHARTTVKRSGRNQRAIEVFWVEQTIRL